MGETTRESDDSGERREAAAEPEMELTAEQRESAWARYMPLVLVLVIAVLAVTRWYTIQREAGEPEPTPPAAESPTPSPPAAPGAGTTAQGDGAQGDGGESASVGTNEESPDVEETTASELESAAAVSE